MSGGVYELGRFHYTTGVAGISKDTWLNIASQLATARQESREVAVVCIGTDCSTGDSLGPLVGSMLTKNNMANVFGTLSSPIHFGNLEESVEAVYNELNNPFIIAVDAALGKQKSIGQIVIKMGGLLPGEGINRVAPFAVGDISVTGVVNEAGFMEYFVLQNTRLSLVMHMASVIADAIKDMVGAKLLPSEVSEVAV